MTFNCAHCELEFVNSRKSNLFPDFCIYCDIAIHEANLETLRNHLKEIDA